MGGGGGSRSVSLTKTLTLPITYFDTWHVCSLLQDLPVGTML